MSNDNRTAAPSSVATEEILGKAYDARLMARLWGFVRPHWRLLIIALVLMPITVAFELTQPYLLKIAIDEHIVPLTPEALSGIGSIAALYVGCVLLQAGALFSQLYALQLLGQRSMHDLRLATYRHITEQRSAFFDRMPVGRLLTRMTNDVESINEMFASGVITLVADVVKLVAIVGMMLVLNARLALMIFVTFPLLLVLVGYSRRVMRTSFRAIRVKLAAMNSFVQEQLSGIKIVQLFGRESRSAAEYDRINHEYREAYLGTIRADAAMYALVEAIGVIAVAGIAWYAGGKIGQGLLTVGLVVAFIEYVNKFFIPVRDFSAKYTVMQSAMAAAERITSLLDTHEPDAPSGTEPGPTPANSETAVVAFRDLHFSYRAGQPVLHGINLELLPGQTVAVVGATGSGKSTIIKLLTRLYEADSGSVLLHGRDVRNLEVSNLRRRITVVSQDVFLFAGTVADNVRLGNLNATDAQIEDALARVGADRMLARRGDDSHAEVVERGANFSAGERQLIAFARALVRDPEVLILDEATAHVDPEAEAWIESGLTELMTGRTTLVIAHRLSTIRHADQILVMARGQVIERGTHESLLAAGGAYARLERTFSRL